MLIMLMTPLVSDVFHNGAPDSTLWEFRHGNGSFKRGDIMGLREIKRRASRHTLINRDTFPTGPKSLAPAHPQLPLGMPQQETTPSTLEDRLSLLEHSYFDMHARLGRSEDALVYMTNKCHLLSDGLMRCHQVNIKPAMVKVLKLMNVVEPRSSDLSYHCHFRSRESNP
jgi:hypothetical protein